MAQTDKILATRVASSCGQPKVATEKPNAGQIEREKKGSAEKKVKGIHAQKTRK